MAIPEIPQRLSRRYSCFAHGPKLRVDGPDGESRIEMAVGQTYTWRDGWLRGSLTLVDFRYNNTSERYRALREQGLPLPMGDWRAKTLFTVTTWWPWGHRRTHEVFFVI